jgi:hypothetical protein
VYLGFGSVSRGFGTLSAPRSPNRSCQVPPCGSGRLTTCRSHAQEASWVPAVIRARRRHPRASLAASRRLLEFRRAVTRTVVTWTSVPWAYRHDPTRAAAPGTTHLEAPGASAPLPSVRRDSRAAQHDAVPYLLRSEQWLPRTLPRARQRSAHTAYRATTPVCSKSVRPADRISTVGERNRWRTTR